MKIFVKYVFIKYFFHFYRQVLQEIEGCFRLRGGQSGLNGQVVGLSCLELFLIMNHDGDALTYV